ncbi:MAG: hypothetical protein ACOCQD_01195 [archaeon]
MGFTIKIIHRRGDLESCIFSFQDDGEYIVPDLTDKIIIDGKRYVIKEQVIDYDDEILYVYVRMVL